MDTQPLSGLPQLMDHIIADMARALCQRRDEPHQMQAARAQGAAQSIRAFQPDNAVEAMIAGHCVMLHEVIVDSVETTLRGEPDAMRRATRSGIVAMDKAFGANLVRLERYRARHTGSPADALPTDARAETEVADRVHRHQSGAAAGGESSPGSSSPGIVVPRHATAEAIPPPPQIPGVDRPCEADSAAVTPMQGLNRQARREIGRRSRKRIDPGPSPIASADRLCSRHESGFTPVGTPY
jgi:hypothetical protein